MELHIWFAAAGGHPTTLNDFCAKFGRQVDRSLRLQWRLLLSLGAVGVVANGWCRAVGWAALNP
jgi:hypothetical protein